MVFSLCCDTKSIRSIRFPARDVSLDITGERRQRNGLSHASLPDGSAEGNVSNEQGPGKERLEHEIAGENGLIDSIDDG